MEPILVLVGAIALVGALIHLFGGMPFMVHDGLAAVVAVVATLTLVVGLVGAPSMDIGLSDPADTSENEDPTRFQYDTSFNVYDSNCLTQDGNEFVTAQTYNKTSDSLSCSSITLGVTVTRADDIADTKSIFGVSVDDNPLITNETQNEDYEVLGLTADDEIKFKVKDSNGYQWEERRFQVGSASSKTFNVTWTPTVDAVSEGLESASDSLTNDYEAPAVPFTIAGEQYTWTEQLDKVVS